MQYTLLCATHIAPLALQDPEVVRALMDILEGAVFGETVEPKHGESARTPEEIGAEA